MTQAVAAAAVEARGLTKQFGSAAARHGFGLEVPPGSVFGFLGSNRAGTTIALHIWWCRASKKG